MTEKDKMLRQLMYDANYDQQLIAERQQAKELCYDYNQLRPSDEASQRALMQRLLGSSKKAADDNKTAAICEYAGHISPSTCLVFYVKGKADGKLVNEVLAKMSV